MLQIIDVIAFPEQTVWASVLVAEVNAMQEIRICPDPPEAFVFEFLPAPPPPPPGGVPTAPVLFVFAPPAPPVPPFGEFPPAPPEFPLPLPPAPPDVVFSFPIFVALLPPAPPAPLFIPKDPPVAETRIGPVPKEVVPPIRFGFVLPVPPAPII